MDTLTITLTNARQIDGYIQAANNAGMSPEALALEFISAQGARYADGFKIGVITGAAFIARFTPAEYGAILTAAETNEAVAGLIADLTASPNVALDDPRLAPGLALLVSEGLLDAARPAEILSYDRPEPVRARIEGVDYIRARDEEGRFVADDPATADVNEAWVKA